MPAAAAAFAAVTVMTFAPGSSGRPGMFQIEKPAPGAVVNATLPDAPRSEAHDIAVTPPLSVARPASTTVVLLVVR